MTRAEQYVREHFRVENSRPRSPSFYGDRVPSASPKAMVTPTGSLVIGGEIFSPIEAVALEKFIWAWFRPNGADLEGECG